MGTNVISSASYFLFHCFLLCKYFDKSHLVLFLGGKAKTKVLTLADR
jgi:hypothetical protein